MDKGARIRILYGEGKDQTGTVFWKGPNKFGGGDRLGVSGDDGQTWWVNSDAVELLGEDDPATRAPTFAKGDRVAWGRPPDTGTGTVFWVGESRRGPGQRLGVNDDHGEEAVWLDGHQVRPLEEGEVAAEPEWVPDAAPPAWEGPSEPPALDEPPAFDEPPPDDAWYDTQAASAEDEDEPPPDAW